MHLLIGTTWYYFAIYIVFTYFASFTGYEDNIFKVSSYLHVQRCKFGGKIDKFGKKSFLKLNSVEFMEFVFSKSGICLHIDFISITRNGDLADILHPEGGVTQNDFKNSINLSQIKKIYIFI